MENEKPQPSAGESSPASSLLPGETRREARDAEPRPPAEEARRTRHAEPAVAAPVVEADTDDEEGADSDSDSQAEGSAQPGGESAEGRTGKARRRRRGRGGKGRRGERPAAAEAAPLVRAEKPLQPTMDHLSGVRGPSEEAPATERPARRERGERKDRGDRREREPRREPAPAEAPELEEPRTAEPASARKSKGVVVLSIGLPGSGKSSWFKRHNITPLSSDQIRFLLFDDETDQRFPDLVFNNLRQMLLARLKAKRPMSYVDATNLTPHDRQIWIKTAQDYAYEVHAVFFDVPLEVCLLRNQTRKRQVDDEVLRKMAAKLKPPTFDEGFTKITVVRVKKKSDGATVDNEAESAEVAPESGNAASE